MNPGEPGSVAPNRMLGRVQDRLCHQIRRIKRGRQLRLAVGQIAPPDPRFLRALTLVRKLQLSGTVGMRVKVDASSKQAALLTFRTAEVSPETLEDSRELRQLLRLDPGLTDFRLVFGATASDDQEVAVLTRSIIHIMQTMATQVGQKKKVIANYTADRAKLVVKGTDRDDVITVSPNFATSMIDVTVNGVALVTGQDAALDGLQRIAEGKQSMTIYKPIIPLANAAVEAAIKLGRGEALTGASAFRNDALGKDVQAILLEVTTVDKDNLMTTVIKDGYAKYEVVYKIVPETERPKQQ